MLAPEDDPFGDPFGGGPELGASASGALPYTPAARLRPRSGGAAGEVARLEEELRGAVAGRRCVPPPPPAACARSYLGSVDAPGRIWARWMRLAS